MTRIAQTDADGVFLALAKREVVGQRGAEALVEQTGVPVIGRVNLEIVEKVEVDGEFIVGFVGDELG